MGGNLEPEGINSKECLIALKVKLHEIIQQEIEKALEAYYLESMQRKSQSSSLYGFIDTKRLWNQNKGTIVSNFLLIIFKDQLQTRKSIRESEAQNQDAINTQQTEAMQREHLALQEMFEGSDYDPPSEDGRTRRNNRRRRGNMVEYLPLTYISKKT